MEAIHLGSLDRQEASKTSSTREWVNRFQRRMLIVKENSNCEGVRSDWLTTGRQDNHFKFDSNDSGYTPKGLLLAQSVLHHSLNMWLGLMD